MIFSPQLSLALVRYMAKNKLEGRERYPLALMLEPTFRCNLACAGCGKIREYKDVMSTSLSMEECLDAARECAAPVVCLTGGEPLLHPEIQGIVEGIIDQGQFVYLCSNGLVLERHLQDYTPSPYLSLVLHLDGPAEFHDGLAGRAGVFDTALHAMRAAREAGFRVLVNTTLYRASDPQGTLDLFHLLTDIPVDGIMVAPAFGYQANDNDIFMTREEAIAAFQPVYVQRGQFRFYNTPVYIDFLAGKRELSCVPWSTPTRNVKGWKRPCYLLTDGYCSSFQELMEDTSWEKYGVGRHPHCANCMAHCGFEAGALAEITGSVPSLWNTIKWQMFSR
jgi:hopanoid biosynthesis associated radical SAM protein HpnH